MLESIYQDALYAWRGLRRSRGMFAIAVLTIALGTGAVTAVFSAVDRILFRELPYPHSERLVWFGVRAPINVSEFLLEGSYWEFREHQHVFEEVTSMSRAGDCDLNERNAARVSCGGVAANFLHTFGIHPLIGRPFTAEEDQPNGPYAALLAYGLWQQRYGADPHVLGRTINVDGRAAQIIGVLPRDFEMPNLVKVDLLVPQQLKIAPHGAGNFLYAFGRLKPGVGVEQARAALLPIYRETLKDVPPAFLKEVSFSISPLRDRQVRDHRMAAAVLFWAVVGLLLIACANVASLLLARAAGRQRELAVRSAIGAGRFRLARQVIIESLILSAAGGIAGLALGAVLLRVFRALAPEGIPRLAQASLDSRVLAFTLATSVACGLIFGLAPALQPPRLEALNSARTTGRGLRLRQALVAVQVALSIALLSGAGLLMRSFWNMELIPLGLNPEHVLTVQLHLSEQYGNERQRSAFFERALERIRSLPGLRSVALADTVPLAGHQFQIIYSNMMIEGRPPATANIGTGGMVVDRTVTPGYFAAMGIPILRGRAFTEADRASEEQAIILGASLARRMFPGEDPVGLRMRPFADVPFWRRIVGVAADVKNSGLVGKDDPEFYRVWRNTTDGNRRRAYLVLRTEANSTMMAELVRAQVAQLDPALPVTVAPMRQIVGEQIAGPLFQTSLLTLFAVIGVLLAAVGQFGVIGTLVTHRSAEIGIRMAVGATPRDVVALVAGHATGWTLAGALAGVAAAWWGARFLGSLLYGVKPDDLISFIGALAILMAVSILAAWAPARRAARIDPARLLRQE
jgi:putative ABC transport system permease protein